MSIKELMAVMADLEARLKRLETCESEAMRNASLTLAQQYREHLEANKRRHQDLWCAARNAALMGLLSGCEIGSDNEKRAFRRAKQYADRLHGPLESSE